MFCKDVESVVSQLNRTITTILCKLGLNDVTSTKRNNKVRECIVDHKRVHAHDYYPY